MSEFFHVDISKQLTLGKVIKNDTIYDNRNYTLIENFFDKNDLLHLINELYPDGLSEHGKTYFLDSRLAIPGPNGPKQYVPNMPMIELIFELVRRLEFPYQISRFQA